MISARQFDVGDHDIKRIVLESLRESRETRCQNGTHADGREGARRRIGESGIIYEYNED